MTKITDFLFLLIMIKPFCVALWDSRSIKCTYLYLGDSNGIRIARSEFMIYNKITRQNSRK